MSQFLGMAKNGFKTGLVYRAHFFIGLLRIPMALLIYYFLWGAIYSHSGSQVLNGYTFVELISYYVLSMVFGAITYCDIDNWMGWDIRTGNVVRDFIWPMAYMKNLFSSFIGMRVLAFLIEVLPTVVVAFVFFPIPIPNALMMALSILSVVMAGILSYFMAFNIGLIAFWFNEIYGIRKIKNALAAFLEGSLIPLTFFPLFWQQIFKYLPFQYMRFIPVNIWLGKYAFFEVGEFLLIQAIWVVGLFILSKIFYQRAFKKFAGAGV